MLSITHMGAEAILDGVPYDEVQQEGIIARIQSRIKNHSTARAEAGKQSRVKTAERTEEPQDRSQLASQIVADILEQVNSGDPTETRIVPRHLIDNNYGHDEVSLQDREVVRETTCEEVQQRIDHHQSEIPARLDKFPITLARAITVFALRGEVLSPSEATDGKVVSSIAPREIGSELNQIGVKAAGAVSSFDVFITVVDRMRREGLIGSREKNGRRKLYLTGRADPLLEPTPPQSDCPFNGLRLLEDNPDQKAALSAFAKSIA